MYAADTYYLEDDSFMTQAADFVTRGLPATVVSAGLGVINTGISLGNLTGLDIDSIDTIDTTRALLGDEVANYYKKNEQLVDTLGFVASSIIPGAGAVRALRAGQSKLANAAAREGSGLMTQTASKLIGSNTSEINRITKAIRNGQHSMSEISNLGWKITGGSFKQAALESVAFESAALLVNNQNSVMNPQDLDYIDAVTSNVDSLLLGVGIGTLGGGAIGTFLTRGELKRAQQAFERGDTSLKAMGNISDPSVKNANAGDNLVNVYSAHADAVDGIESLNGVSPVALNRTLKSADDNMKALITGMANRLWKGPKSSEGKAVAAESAPKEIVKDFLVPFLNKETDPDEIAKAFGGLKSIEYAGTGKFQDAARKGIMERVDADLANTRKIGRAADERKESLLERTYYGIRDPKLKPRRAYKNSPARTVEAQRNLPAKNFSGMVTKIRTQVTKDGFDANPEHVMAMVTYGTKTAVKDVLRQTKVGFDILDEAKELVRVALPDLHKQLNDVKLSTLSPEDLGRYMKESKIHDPEAVLSYGIRAMENLRRQGKMDKAAKVSPTLAKLANEEDFVTRYLETSLYYNTRTRAFSTQPMGLTAADLGPVAFKNERLIYGARGERTITKTGTYSVEDLVSGKIDVADYTAQWALAGAKAFKVSAYAGQKKKAPIKITDLPRIQQIAEEMGKLPSEALTKLEDKLAKNPITIVDDLAEDTQVITNLTDLSRVLLEAKQRELIKLVNYNQVSRRFSSEDLAEILDTSVDFVARMGIPEATTKVARGKNYLKTENLKLNYESSNLERSFSVGRGLAEVQQRVSKIREAQIRETVAYFGEENKLLEQNALQRGDSFDPNSMVTTVSEAQTYLKSFIPKNMGEMFWQSIGKATSAMRQKRIDEIGASVASTSKAIKANREAIAELGVVNSKLASGDYAIATYDEIKILAEALGEFGEIGSSGNYLVPAKLLADLVGDNPGRIKLQDLHSYFEWHGKTLKISEVKTKEVGDFLLTLRAHNQKFVRGSNKYKQITGEGYNWNEFTLPAITPNLSELPEIAVVEFKSGNAFGETKGILAARNSNELNDKINALQKNRQDVDIRRVSETEERAKLVGDFDMNLAFTDSVRNVDMRKQGIQWDVMPEADANLVDRFTNSAISRQFNLDRNYVRLHYMEDFRALELEDAAINPNSIAAKRSSQSQTLTPQRKMINAALGLHNYDEYKWHRTIQEVAAQGVDNFSSKLMGFAGKLSEAYRAGKTYADGKKAVNVDETWELMDKFMADHGMPQVFNGAEDYIQSTSKVSRKVAESVVSKLNGFVSFTTLRLDQIQGMVNALSLPITLMPAIRELNRIVGNDVLDAALKNQMGVKIPGTENTFKANMKVMHAAVKDFFQDRELVKKYRELGIVSHDLHDLLQSIESVGAAVGRKDIKEMDNVLGKVFKAGTFLTDQSEEFTRFVSARAAERILDDIISQVPSDVGAKVLAQKKMVMNSIATRVNGNYIAAQRPSMFQGWMGQMFGLFQTYQFNLIQTLVRNIEDGDLRNVIQMTGLQGSIFGTQSIPGFQAINEHIGKQNAEHTDIYSTVDEAFGDELSHFLLYGAASSVSLPLGAGINFYTRGDLTPRTPILVPTSFDQVPVVSFMTKAVNNVKAAFSNAGHDFSEDTLYQMMAHNGLNRPLSGLGQLLMGKRTTAQGSTVIDVDASDNMYLTGLVKLLGTNTTDESITLDAFYRAKNYQSARQAELNSLGQGVRSSIRAGNAPDLQGLMQDYIATGGDGANFDRWMQHQFDVVNESQVEDMRNSLTTPEGRYLQAIMN